MLSSGGASRASAAASFPFGASFRRLPTSTAMLCRDIDFLLWRAVRASQQAPRQGKDEALAPPPAAVGGAAPAWAPPAWPGKALSRTQEGPKTSCGHRRRRRHGQGG